MTSGTILSPQAGLDAGPQAGRDASVLPVASVATSLSPSRAADFMACPLLYRFRVIDRLPQKPSAVATRGTVVHAVLERLFDLPAAERTPDRAQALVRPEWERLREEEPELADLFPADDACDEWLRGAEELLEAYFALEDPRRLEPADRELFVECELDSGLRLRGYVDRVDVAASGAVRVVDYKTGRAPREGFEAKAMFQMKFYALVLSRISGRIPALLQLVYLGSGEVLRYQPDAADLMATERKLAALWDAIRRATDTGDWRAKPSKLCDWCDHQALCPAFGGTPPPLPALVPAPAVPAQGRQPGVALPRSGAGVPGADERPSPTTPDDEV